MSSSPTPPAAPFDQWDARRFPPGPRSDFRKWWDARIVRSLVDEGGGGGAVLDLPCGAGRLTIAMGRDGMVASGSDIDENRLRLARARIAEAGLAPRVFVSDAKRIPIRDKAVDGVLSIRFLYYPTADERQVIYREFTRVARRWIVLQYNHDGGLRGFLQSLRNRMNRGTRRPKMRKSLPMAQIRAELAAAGLVPHRVRYVSRLFSERVFILCRIS